MYFTIFMINYIHHKLYRGNLLRFSMLRLTKKTTSNVDFFLKNFSSFFIFLLLFLASSTASSTREIFFIFSIIILQIFYWLQWSVYCMEFVFCCCPGWLFCLYLLLRFLWLRRPPQNVCFVWRRFMYAVRFCSVTVRYNSVFCISCALFLRCLVRVFTKYTKKWKWFSFWISQRLRKNILFFEFHIFVWPQPPRTARNMPSQTYTHTHTSIMCRYSWKPQVSCQRLSHTHLRLIP